LPGTGKSYFSRRLALKISAIILESDALRKTLFPVPLYSPRESGQLFATINILTGRLLRQGISVILDATNLIERHREVLYQIAEKNRARLIIVYLEAPAELVKERLRQRCQDAGNKSDADYAVYLKMRASVEEIKRPHYIVDTAQDISPFIEKIVKAVTE
jgi:predicted kinase